jgi:hypothetical protein
MRIHLHSEEGVEYDSCLTDPFKDHSFDGYFVIQNKF